MAIESELKYPTPSQPRQVRLDSTSFCNASCLSCHRVLSQRKGEMPRDLVMNLLEDISQWEQPLDEIVPVNYGEFFLYKNWFWLLQQIEKKLLATRIVIPTNGSLLTVKTVEKLATIKNWDLINFSINAFFDETYKRFTGLEPSVLTKFPQLMLKIRELRPDVTIWASMVFDPIYHTEIERDLFIEAWKQFAFPQVLTASSAGRADNKPLYRTSLPCRSIFSDFVVGYDGKLSSCCWDSNFFIDLGYLQDYGGDILKAWNNEKFKELRRLHNAGQRSSVSLCRVCSYA